MKLTANSYTYRFEDESGYIFDVDASFDPECGWAASLTISVHGVKTVEGAVTALRAPAEHFLRELAEQTVPRHP